MLILQEVYGREYSFGGHQYSFSGIYDISPKQVEKCDTKKTLYLSVNDYH